MKALLDEVAHRRPDGLLDAVDVVGQARHEIAGRGPVEIGRGLAEDVAVEPVAHGLDDLVPDGLHEEGGKEGEDALPEDDDHDDERQDALDVVFADMEEAPEEVEPADLGGGGGRAGAWGDMEG